MSKVLTTIGMKIGIAVEETAGKKPTSFKHIPKIYEMDLPSVEPSTAETTTYDNLKNTSSVPILADTGDTYGLTARGTTLEDAETVWNAAVTEYESDDTGKRCWLCITIADAKNSYMYPIVPRKTELPSDLPLNDVVAISMYYTLDGDIETVSEAPSFVEAMTISMRERSM